MCRDNMPPALILEGHPLHSMGEKSFAIMHAANLSPGTTLGHFNGFDLFNKVHDYPSP
jgi:hypothetical protein